MLGVVVALSLGCASQGLQGYSDPLRPPVADQQVVEEVPFYQIPARLKAIEEEIEQETDALNSLSPFQVGKQFDTFGYHSDFVPAVQEVPDKPLWVLEFSRGAFPTMAFVMVPALDQRSPELRGYAFPKRFRIYSVNAQGEKVKKYVDWTERDFPDPGMRPVYFSFPEDAEPTGNLRLEVYSGHEENGLEYFALGRVHPIRQGALQKTKLMWASSSFESAPYWGQNYLSSSKQYLGMPLSSREESGGNLIVELPAAHLDKPLVVRLDLKEKSELGWVNLFPGQSPDSIAVPGYGFPDKMRIFRLVKKQNKSGYNRFPLDHQIASHNPGNNMLRLSGYGVPIDALEIECNDFPVYQGRAVFSLGEVEVFLRGQNISRGSRVSIRGGGSNVPNDLSVLVDGQVNGRSILPLYEWIEQLAAGKTHEARLIALQSEYTELDELWQRIRRSGLLTLMILLVAGVCIFVFVVIRGKKQAELRLRRQIYSDLHDEVGSNLGSISLMAGQLERVARSDRMKEGMFDLSLMTREAYASLREVVWMVDQSSIRLPMLLQKLSERAERVLIGVDLLVDVPEDCPDQVVSLTCKRHVIMFFKELVHNCARHAKATQVKVAFVISQKQLRILVSDNGCGFDASIQSDGWGLASMKQRAQELGGEMVLTTNLGEGTTIELIVPLGTLSKEPNKAYKTSN